MPRAVLTVACVSAWVLAACSDRPVFDAGDTCSLNSDCEPPLVCRLDRCRAECAGARDCEIGSICVRDEAGLGSCRLMDEAECMLNSDCPAPLVCRFAQCTNECAVDADCLAGSMCRADDATSELGCFDPSETGCLHDSDCAAGLVCKPDGRCREECVSDVDCRDGLTCTGPPGMRVCA